MSTPTERRLVVALVLLVIATAAATLISTSTTTSRAARAEVGRVFDRVAAGASASARVFLDPAEQLAQLSGSLISAGVIGGDPDAFEGYLLDQLEARPDLAGLYLGRTDGSFTYVSRIIDDVAVTRTKHITVDAAGQRSTTLTFRDAERITVRDETDPEDTYDPRVRPWYVRATAASTTIWTPPYVFFTSRQPGITAALAVHDKTSGAVTGVFGVDLELDELSDVLSRYFVSTRGSSFIVDETGHVIAAATHPDLAVSVGEEVELVAADAVENPDLRAAAVASGVTGPGTRVASARTVERSYTYGGDEWRLRVTPFAEARWPWSLVVYAPESDFLPELRKTQGLNTALTGAIALIAMLLALVLGSGFLRPAARARRSAATDPLTRLANRRRLDQQGTAILKTDHGAGVATAVIVADLDKFKAVNDHYGHVTGDEVLVAVARRFSRTIKEADLLARFGGEEFVVVLAATGGAGAHATAERLRRAIADAPINTNEGPIPLTVSLGVATTMPGGPEPTLTSMIASADTALYRAKSAGRNRVAFSTEPLVPAEHDTHHALDDAATSKAPNDAATSGVEAPRAASTAVAPSAASGDLAESDGPSGQG